MYTEIFQEIGLTPNEAKIYEVLLSTGDTSVADIAVKARIHRRNIYDALNRLMDKGLVFRIFQGREHLFRAVAPEKLVEVLKEKESKLLKILPDLNTLYAKDYPTDAAYIYKGVEGFKNYMRDLVAVGEETYFLGAKALWYSPQVSGKFFQDFLDASARKGFRHYTIFDPRVKDVVPEITKDLQGDQYKFLPENYQTPGVVDIFGDRVVTFTSVDVANFGDDGTIFVMINKELAETYKTWFRFIWDFLPK